MARKSVEFGKRDYGSGVFHYACLKPLGLTAYGPTHLVAKERLKKMFGMLLDISKEN